MADAVQAATRAELSGEHYGEVTAAITLLHDAGKAGEVVGEDMNAEDFLQLTGLLWRADAGADWPLRSQHLLDLVLDALTRRQV